jgi:hypothetical protein
VGPGGSLATEPLADSGRAGARGRRDRLCGARPPLPQAPLALAGPAGACTLSPRPLRTPRRPRAPPPTAARRRPRVRRVPPALLSAAGLVRSSRTPLFVPHPALFRECPEGAARRLRSPEWAGRPPLPSRAPRPGPALTPSLGPRPGPAQGRPAARSAPTCTARAVPRPCLLLGSGEKGLSGGLARRGAVVKDGW